jgi:hypothetical protein
MPRAAYRKRQGFDEAVQKCATKAKSIDKGLVIASREEVRLTDAVKELLQKKVTTYGRYLKQVEYVGDRGLVSSPCARQVSFVQHEKRRQEPNPGRDEEPELQI